MERRLARVRCYASLPGRTFVTYGDAQRVPLYAGMQTRRPNYVLEPERLLDLASTYARELGYTATQPGIIAGVNTTIEAGESTEVAIPPENGQPPVVITISLYSSGDIRLLASDESFRATPPFDPEDLPGWQIAHALAKHLH